MEWKGWDGKGEEGRGMGKNKNYQGLTNLIQEWLEEKSDYDEKMWPEFKKYLDHSKKPKENRWISVKEKLPLDYDWVLVCQEGKVFNEPCPISLAYYDSGEWKFLAENKACWDDMRWEIDYVTHWHPIDNPRGKL